LHEKARLQGSCVGVVMIHIGEVMVPVLVLITRVFRQTDFRLLWLLTSSNRNWNDVTVAARGGGGVHRVFTL